MMSRQAYRLFLRAFPKGFREANGEEMEDAFLSLLRMAGVRKGWAGKAAIWFLGGWDALKCGLRERLQVGKAPQQGNGSPNGANSGGGSAMLETIWGDIRFCVRGLIRRPLFSLSVILTLSVGIGANASVFTLVDGLLLTPLPYEEPEELVVLWEENQIRDWSRVNVSPLNAQDWKERARSLEDLATFYSQDLTLLGQGDPALTPTVRVSPNALELLGTAPFLGRGFTEEEVGVGRDRVVMLTHGFWQRQFGGDRAILGQTLDLQGVSRVVVGVLPEGFRFLDEEPDLFLPLDLVPTDHARHEHFLKSVARLAPGVGLQEARVELNGIAALLEEEYPDSNRGWGVQILSARDEMLGPAARPAALALMAAVALVLLMVCVNVANLALVRGEHRTRELALRTALGAGRKRIIRQLLTESLMLGLLGGGLGFLFANWGYRAVVATLPNHTSPIFQFGLDGSVLAFTLTITLLSALLFGTIPALRFSRSGMEALRDGGRSGRSISASRFGSALVVTQTALALVLLVSGGILAKRIAEMKSQELGFDPENVVTLRIAPPASEYPGPLEVAAFWEAVENRVAQVPGVLAVGSTQSHPLMNATWLRTVRLMGEDFDRTARLTYASGGLFEALGFRTVRGRPLRADDELPSARSAVVNEAFVREYLGSAADPLAVSLGSPVDTLPPLVIVGVVQDVMEGGVDEAPGPSLYLSFAQAPVRQRSLVIKTSGPPTESLAAVKAAVWSVDPKLPMDRVETLKGQVDRHIGGFAVVANLMVAFALVSLLLGALGIYGVTAYAAGRRVGEIGIRVALGAEPRDVVRMVVGQGWRRTALGLALGLIVAYFVTGTMGSLFVGLETRDPSVFLAVALVLGVVSHLALWIPARKAAAVDPTTALSRE